MDSVYTTKAGLQEQKAECAIQDSGKGRHNMCGEIRENRELGMHPT